MKLPALAEWLLTRVLDPVGAESVAGDLLEEYAARRRVSRLRAWLRLWLQLAATVANRAFFSSPSATRFPRSQRSMHDVFWSELRQAGRGLIRTPGFTLGAVIPLAIAIALGATVFAVVHTVLIRDLPFAAPDRLVVIGEHDPGEPASTLGYETFLDLRAATSFDGMAAMAQWAPTLTSPATTRLRGMRVTSGYFSMLGVRPALGRDFLPEDDTPATRRVAILSDATWRRHFNADPNVVNRVFRLNEVEYRVVGVLPADFEPVISSHLYAPAEIWAPLGYEVGGPSSCRSCRHLRAVGSLKPGVSRAVAQEELRGLHAALRLKSPRDYGEDMVSAESLSERIGRPLRRPLLTLLLAVLLVLVIAAANGASLALARFADHSHHHALRAALGASRLQLVRHQLLEAALLAATTLVLGLFGAQMLTTWFVANAPETLPRADQISLGGVVWLVSSAMTVLVFVTIAVLPHLRPHPGLTAHTRTTAGRGLARLRETLIVADIAIALTLSVSAALMARSVARLLDVDPGFATTNIHTVGLSLVGPRWAEDAAVLAFQNDLLTRVAAIPGVEAAAVSGQVPLGGSYDRRGGYLEERRTNRAEDGVEFERYSITPGYLELMNIPLRRGRGITTDDRTETTPVMLVNETAARTYWPGQDPIGRRVAFGRAERLVTVVGVVGDVRHYGLDEPPAPQMYMPQSQMTDSFLVLSLRTQRFPEVLPAVRSAIGGIAADVPTYDIQSMDDLLAASAAGRRFTALLLGFFALASAAMSAVGLYGVVAYMVSQRTREFGIRMALGASRSKIRELVLRRGIALALSGTGLGVAGAWLTSQLLRDQLYETSAFDPLALALGVAVLLAVIGLAHVVPVARATRVSPTVALRGD